MENNYKKNILDYENKLIDINEKLKLKKLKYSEILNKNE